MKQTSLLIGISTLAIALFTGILAEANDVDADRNNNPHKGNNGQCRKLQSTFPPEIQDYQGCHDTFTGPGHNTPPPLP